MAKFGMEGATPPNAPKSVHASPSCCQVRLQPPTVCHHHHHHAMIGFNVVQPLHDYDTLYRYVVCMHVINDLSVMCVTVNSHLVLVRLSVCVFARLSLAVCVSLCE